MNGFIVVDKPAGLTSHDVVNRVRRLTGEQSVGHLGTLDPLATGVLPLLLGKWTRLAQFFGKLEKTYTGKMRLGIETDSYDSEGQIVGEAVSVSVTQSQVESAAAALSGLIEQMPPVFSAKKVGGKSAHKLARAGKQVELRAVPVKVHRFDVALHDDFVCFETAISAGGYVRSLVHDLGQRLGCGAHLFELRRTAAGPFTLEDSLSLDQLGALVARDALTQAMKHPRLLLPELPATTADTYTAGRLRNGVAVNLPEFSQAELVKIFEGRDQLIGVGRRIAGTLFQPVCVLA